MVLQDVAYQLNSSGLAQFSLSFQFDGNFLYTPLFTDSLITGALGEVDQHGRNVQHKRKASLGLTYGGPILDQ